MRSFDSMKAVAEKLEISDEVMQKIEKEFLNCILDEYSIYGFKNLIEKHFYTSFSERHVPISSYVLFDKNRINDSFFEKVYSMHKITFEPYSFMWFGNILKLICPDMSDHYYESEFHEAKYDSKYSNGDEE